MNNMAQQDEYQTISSVLTCRKNELLASWIRNILDLPGNRTLKLMAEHQLQQQAGELLDTLLEAFGSGNYMDINAPEYKMKHF
ncbi:MAG: RsbRD N-terminal domain-containing protein [Magnetococcales bacterium]|nr:RsbRD N-terminal domain-containing protein [Magnetococcales bacterium]